MNVVETDKQKLTPPADATADQIVLMTRVEALRQRAQARTPWSTGEMDVLLQGALDVALIGKDVTKGSALLSEAEQSFGKALQTNNRNWYLLALLLGVVLVALVTYVVLLVAGKAEFRNLAPPEVIVSLFAFAGMGSLTSVLTRLSSLDFSTELSKKFVMYSAVAKPLVAVSFASVVYLILKNDLVTFGKLSGSTNEAVLWIAAFLCGFSERFAEDMIERIMPAERAPAAS